MSNISPIPSSFPLVQMDGETKGCYTTYFKRFLDDLLNRVGGVTGGVYTRSVPTSAAFVWDLNANPNTTITLTDPTTTINTINQVAGAPPYRLTIIQDNVGGRLVALGGEFKNPSGVFPALSAGANAVDQRVWASDGVDMLYQYGQNDLR